MGSHNHLALVHADKVAMEVLRYGPGRDGEFIALLEKDDNDNELIIKARPQRRKVQMGYVLPAEQSNSPLAHQFGAEALKAWAERLAIPASHWP
jgi:hypothetical protein